MNRDLALSIMAGLLSALAFLSVAAGYAIGFLLSYVAPLPLMIAGLSLGLPGALIASLAGAGVIAAVMGLPTAIAFLIVAVLPTLIVTRQSLLFRTIPGDGNGRAEQVEYYPPGLVLGWLTATSLVLIALAAVMIPTGEQGLEAFIRTMIENGIGAMAPELGSDERDLLLRVWVPLFPALVGATWLVMASLNAVSGQKVAQRLNKARRPSPIYRHLSLPDWMLVAMAGAIAAGWLAEGDLGYLARNAGAVLAVPFGLVGLTVVHDWAGRKPQARMILAGFYVVLVLAFQWVAIVLVGLGLTRQWVRLRWRGSARSGKEE